MIMVTHPLIKDKVVSICGKDWMTALPERRRGMTANLQNNALLSQV